MGFAHTEIAGRGIVVGPPKSRAGVRTVVVPKAIRPDLLTHMRAFTAENSTALIVTGAKERRSGGATSANGSTGLIS